MVQLAAVCLNVGQQLCGCCPERAGSEGCFCHFPQVQDFSSKAPGINWSAKGSVWLRLGDTIKEAILALYLGDKYQDTAISELILWVA